MRGGGERVVRLELDHRPHRYAHRSESVFERVELREQRPLHAFARLVAGPERIAERFNDVVGGDADVRAAFLDQFEHRVQHARHGAERRILLLEAAQTVEVAEELVCPVDEMHYHWKRIVGSRLICSMRATSQAR